MGSANFSSQQREPPPATPFTEQNTQHSMRCLLRNHRNIVRDVHHASAVPISRYEDHLSAMSSCVTNVSEWFEYRSFRDLSHMSDQQRVLSVSPVLSNRELALIFEASSTSYASGQCHHPHASTTSTDDGCVLGAPIEERCFGIWSKRVRSYLVSLISFRRRSYDKLRTRIQSKLQR